MYQLIYTSAPRLLEAGKTGFGTLARSKDMPLPLVSFIERLSSFDRNAGVKAVLFYSVFKQGALHYRVFSRVSEAGADYTGRTNHLAEHFAVEVGSNEDSALMASTPAGVLMALATRWHESYKENPSYLGESALPPGAAGGAVGAWKRHAGNDDCARWLKQPAYRDGACVSFDEVVPERQVLELLHDAFLHFKDHGWGKGMATATVSTLSSQICPFICLDARQTAFGVACPRGCAELKVAPQMKLPLQEVQMGPAPETRKTPTGASPAPAPQKAVYKGPVPHVQPAVTQVPPTNVPPPPRGDEQELQFFGPTKRPTWKKEPQQGEKTSPSVPIIVGVGCILLALFFFMSGGQEADKTTKPQPEQTEQNPKNPGGNHGADGEKGSKEVSPTAPDGKDSHDTSTRETGKPGQNPKEPDANTGNVPDANTGNAPDANTGNAPDANTGNVPDANTGNAPDANTGNAPDANTGNVPGGKDSHDTNTTENKNSDTGSDSRTGKGGQQQAPKTGQNQGMPTDGQTKLQLKDNSIVEWQRGKSENKRDADSALNEIEGIEPQQHIVPLTAANVAKIEIVGIELDCTVIVKLTVILNKHHLPDAWVNNFEGIYIKRESDTVDLKTATCEQLVSFSYSDRALLNIKAEEDKERDIRKKIYNKVIEFNNKHKTKKNNKPVLSQKQEEELLELLKSIEDETKKIEQRYVKKSDVKSLVASLKKISYKYIDRFGGDSLKDIKQLKGDLIIWNNLPTPSETEKARKARQNEIVEDRELVKGYKVKFTVDQNSVAPVLELNVKILPPERK